MEDDEVMKSSACRTKRFIVLYVLLIIIFVLGFFVAAEYIHVEDNIPLMKYILSGGK